MTAIGTVAPFKELKESSDFEGLVRRLHQYGYFGAVDVEELIGLKPTDNLLRDATAKYQEFNSQILRIDGELGEKTATLLTTPRCGMPDIEESRADASLSQWPRSCMKDITTSHRLSPLSPLSLEDEHRAWMTALAGWNKVSGARLSYVPSKLEAKIYAEAGSTSGSTLAWSYLPTNRCNERLQQLYGTRWVWTFAKLVEVITHELGHALGLSHINDVRSIMHPTALGRHTTPQPPEIAEMIRRYGPPDQVPEPEPPGPNDPETLTVTVRVPGYQDGLVTLRKANGGSGGDWGT